MRRHSFDAGNARVLRLAPSLHALHVLTQALKPGCAWTADLKVLVGNDVAAERPRLAFRSGWDGQADWT